MVRPATVSRAKVVAIVAIVVAVIAILFVDATNAPLPAAIQIVPFSTFVSNIASASARSYVDHPPFQVSSDSQFEIMRSYLLGLYAGEVVTYSFETNGAVYDCVPYGQQPGARTQANLANLVLPTSTPAANGDIPNAPVCPYNEIAFRRAGLDEIASYPSLDAYLKSTQLTP